jgi:hypothetical protein
MEALFNPVLQVYVIAPLPLNVAEEPEQMLAEEGFIAIIGKAFTVTVLLKLLVHRPLAPVTV